MNLASCLALLSCLYFTVSFLEYFMQHQSYYNNILLRSSLQALLRCADGTYYFYVELESFSNPSDRDFDGGCCDPACDVCENYFIFCLRQPGYDEGSNLCPYGSFSTAADPDSGSSLQFSTGNDALAPNVDNPIRFAGNTWPVSLRTWAAYVPML